MAAQRVPGAITKLAFAEDAMAIASWCEAHGYLEDAEHMREFAERLRATIPPSARWSHRSEVAA